MAQSAQNVEMVWRMLHQSRRLRDIIDKKMHPFCNENGLTPLALRLLVTLHFEGPMTVSALAKSTCTAGTNNSALCKRLEANGLLCRTRAEDDERRVLVSLSDTGAALVQSFLQQFGTQQGLGGLSCAQDEINTILAGMEQLVCLLEDKGETA